ncbi:hypothetical protein B571_24830 [Salmonella enterica subsp. enterica serovar Typhimurium str. STm1]|nr:hypothetical protein B571_24830 [Salmonella enterica subsp. enterica serovar Typhimurium str. STm1]EQM57925.1 hypothetical protein B578_25935 [Salmonella enterica subsp. enterica serovar Typhimurium str. STm10]
MHLQDIAAAICPTFEGYKLGSITPTNGLHTSIF